MQRFIFLCCLSAIAPWMALSGDLDARFPVRGLSIAAPSVGQVDRFAQFIRRDLAAHRVNTLILRVDFTFAYEAHPELRQAIGSHLNSLQIDMCGAVAGAYGERPSGACAMAPRTMGLVWLRGPGQSAARQANRLADKRKAEEHRRP